MKHFGRHQLVAAVAIASAASFVATAAIAFPAGAAECSGVTTQLVDCSSANDTTGNPVVAVLVVAIQVLTAVVGIAAIASLVYAGILYSSASGEASSVAKAKETIRNAIIGLLLFAGMTILINYLIPGGLFSGSAKFGAGGNGLGSIQPSKVQKIIVNKESDSQSTVTGCYWAEFTKKPSGKLYHRSGKVPYAFGNSVAGIQNAAAKDYKRIDIDIMTTKDGVIVAQHTMSALRTEPIWGGFKDPEGKYKPGTKIQELTFAEVSRLRHVDGYRMYTIDEIIDAVSKTDLTVLFEMKTPKSIEPQLPAIVAKLNKAKVKAAFMGLTHHAGQKDALATARKLGLWTRNITTDKWTGPSSCGGVKQ